MSEIEKLEAIKKLLPEKTSTIFNDTEYCKLVKDIKQILEK